MYHSLADLLQFSFTLFGSVSSSLEKLGTSFVSFAVDGIVCVLRRSLEDCRFLNESEVRISEVLKYLMHS